MEGLFFKGCQLQSARPDRRLLFLHNFHGQANLATIVKAQKLDLYGLALFETRPLGGSTRSVFDLGYVYKAIALAKEVHECTESRRFSRLYRVDRVPTSGSATMDMIMS